MAVFIHFMIISFEKAWTQHFFPNYREIVGNNKFFRIVDVANLGGDISELPYRYT